MSNILGQDKILKILDSFTIQTLPKTIAFIGEAGSGKHSLTNYLSNKFGFQEVTITTDTTSEQLTDYLQDNVEKFYVIDLANFTEKQQNKLLKFVEEPSETVFVILLTTTTAGILPTILNRCKKYQLEPYTKQFLKDNFSNNVVNQNDLVFEICKTPGQLKNVDGNTILDLYNYCKLIIDKAKTTPYANTLAIYTKINYKEEYDKFDLNQFLDILEFAAFENFKETNSETSFTIYNITNKAKQDFLVSKILNKESYMLHFLDSLWRGVR